MGDLYEIAMTKAKWLKKEAEKARKSKRPALMLPADLDGLAAVLEVMGGHFKAARSDTNGDD
tara:strand:- start:39 stop:224 length:186 start_codon:yes stop_codon:yes gene_type:complete